MLELSADCSSATWMPMEPEVPMGEKSISARAQHSACATADGRYLYFFGGGSPTGQPAIRIAFSAWGM